MRIDELHEALRAGEVLGGERRISVGRPAGALREEQPHRHRACRAGEGRERERLDAVRSLGEELERVERRAGRVWVVDPVGAVRCEPLREPLDDARAAMRHDLGPFGRKSRHEAVVDTVESPQREPADGDIATAERLKAGRHVADQFDHGDGAGAVGRRAVAGDLKRRRTDIAEGLVVGLAGPRHRGDDRRKDAIRSEKPT